ncbi:hypothetical protein AB0F43_25830 [Kribbella sp. NPDC023972]|uniref:hypothetical protein n=1 Tax=Kribbella sp. NPDC023972 TaxID=3154795 RepID=UPI0033EC525D
MTTVTSVVTVGSVTTVGGVSTVAGVVFRVGVVGRRRGVIGVLGVDGLVCVAALSRRVGGARVLVILAVVVGLHHDVSSQRAVER